MKQEGHGYQINKKNQFLDLTTFFRVAGHILYSPFKNDAIKKIDFNHFCFEPFILRGYNGLVRAFYFFSNMNESVN